MNGRTLQMDYKRSSRRYESHLENYMYSVCCIHIYLIASHASYPNHRVILSSFSISIPKLPRNETMVEVSGLPDDITSEDLMDKFQIFGSITSIEIHGHQHDERNSEGNEVANSVTTAVVEFSNEEEASAAVVGLSDTTVLPMRVRVLSKASRRPLEDSNESDQYEYGTADNQSPGESATESVSKRLRYDPHGEESNNHKRDELSLEADVTELQAMDEASNQEYLRDDGANPVDKSVIEDNEDRPQQQFEYVHHDEGDDTGENEYTMETKDDSHKNVISKNELQAADEDQANAESGLALDNTLGDHAEQGAAEDSKHSEAALRSRSLYVRNFPHNLTGW